LATTEYASVLRTKNAFSTTPTFVFGTEQCTAGAPGCGDRVTFIAPLVSDPSTPSTFYVGTYRVWKTTSAGVSSSWKAVSDDLTAGPASVGCADAKGFGKLDDGLTVLAVAPSKPEVLYTGAQSGRMFTTKDGGANWTRIDKAPLPGRWVSAIAVDPHNPDVVFASFSGFSDGTPGAPGHVFRSADGGKTWELRDIPADTPVNTILAHGTASDLLYAGTDGGVLFTSDGGKTWSPLGDGLPSVPVFSLVYQRAAGTLVAGTFGRSVWSAALPSGAVTVAPDKLTFSAESGKIPVGQSIKVSAADPSGGVTRFSVAASETWLSETPTTGEVAGAIPQVVHVVASPGKLAVGDHDASITITPEGGGAAITVPVRLTITAPTKPTEEDGGCSCRVGADGSASAWKAIAAMAAIGMLRRRRRG
jgi:MYXO-CTERM domain-containing protein